MLDQESYHSLVASVFQRLLAAVDRADPDQLEAESTGEMVTLTTGGGEKLVVNTQGATRQLWVAGGGRGVHFSYQPAEGKWRDDRGEGLELFSWLNRCLKAAGVEIDLAA